MPITRTTCLSLLSFALAVAAAAAPPRAADAKIPDIAVVDQSGRSLNLHRDLVEGHVVAINFVFTRCRAICPQIGVTSAALARELARQDDPRFRVISVSIDPENDTPERLLQWSRHFGKAPGWTLVTGAGRDIEGLQRALEIYTPDRNLHSGYFLLGNPATDTWKRVDGSTPPAGLAATMIELAAPRSAAAAYFPDATLLDQHGNTYRFYSELIAGRIVVINTFFADCGGVCPLTMQKLASLQTRFQDRVGKDVFLYSITVDPIADTPEKLKDYAARHRAGSGWKFLSGDKANVDLVLKKLGQFVAHRDAHSGLFIVGNEPTGLWKKVNGLADADEIGTAVASVVNDGR